MHIFVRGVEGCCRTLQLDEPTSAAGLKAAIQELYGLPASEQLLVHRGRVLHAQPDLVKHGLANDDTVHVHLRLKGGKGGFGALLRGQGRDGKVTTNFDACRDLNGKRLRLVNAEKQLTEWQAKAPEREAEKAAIQEAKQLLRKAKQEAEAEVNVAAVKAEQQQAVQGVQAAVQDALQALPEVAAAEEHKRKRAAEARAAAKKPKMLAMLEELSSGSDDSGSDSESEASEGTAAKE